MNKKIMAIIIAAIIITLGLVVAINYSNSTKNEVTDIDKKTEDKAEVDNQQDMEQPKNDEENKQETEQETQQEQEKSEDTEKTDISIGEMAPDFTLENLEGEKVSLSDYKGKIVLINFWATWCKFCDIEMPDLNDVDKNNEDVVVLAVNVQEEGSKVSKYIKDGGYGFEVVLDTKGDIARNYLVASYPTTYAVDKDGILVGGVPGMLTKPQIEQIVESVRSGK